MLTAPVSTLYPDRYNAKRSKVYEYLKALGIAPFKVEGDRRSHITLDQLQQLDQYTTLLTTDPNAASDYAAKCSATTNAETALVDASTDVSTDVANVELPPAVRLLVNAIAAQLTAVQSADPNAPARVLQEAYENGFHMRSRDLKRVTGSVPKEGDYVYGFRLEKARRGWWIVDKQGAIKPDDLS